MGQWFSSEDIDEIKKNCSSEEYEDLQKLVDLNKDAIVKNIAKKFNDIYSRPDPVEYKYVSGFYVTENVFGHKKRSKKRSKRSKKHSKR